MKRKMFGFLLILCMAIALLPAGAVAAEFPNNPQTLPVDAHAETPDGWYRFAPTADGIYSIIPDAERYMLALYHVKLSPGEIAAAEQYITDGEQQLADGRQELAIAEAQYAAAVKTQEEMQANYERGCAEHEQKRAEYERNLLLVDLPIIGPAAREIVDAFLDEEYHLRYVAQLLEAQQEEIERGEEVLADGRRQLAEGEAQLQSAKDLVAASKAGKAYTYVNPTTTDMPLYALFEAGSEFLIQVDTEGGTGLACQFLCNAFLDVPQTEYYFNPVYWAAVNHITNGTDPTHFSPDASCTRAQVVTFLWRSANSPQVSGTIPFADVPSDAYYYDAVRWAVSEGITTGTDATHFSPDDVCTRAQVVTFLWRFFDEPNVSTARRFADVSEDAYYFRAVSWALRKYITNGTSYDTFSPDQPCTRAQVVTFLNRAMR